MFASAKSFSFMSNCDENNFKFVVPFFQRPYVWTKDNWQDLLDDLTKEEQHFLGSVILKKEGNAPVHYVIIDGQQRITTISILLKVIYDILKPMNELYEDPEHWIKDSLFISKGNEKIIRVQHSHHDKDNFERLIGRIEYDKNDKARSIILSPELDSISLEIQNEIENINNLLRKGKKEKEIDIDNNNLIRSCYKYFLFRLTYKYDNQKNEYIKLSSDDKDNISKLNSILNTLFCQSLFVVITVDDNEHEQEIFDTINSAGVRLSCTDIIKNKLYEKYNSLVNSETETLEFYENTWQKTFEDEDNYAFWTKEKNVGRNLRTNLELFFQAYGIIFDTEEKIYDVERDTLSNLADNYKQYIDKIQTKDKIESFINDIMQTANIYYKKLPSFEPQTAIQFTEIDKRIALLMYASDNTTFTPYLLYLYKTYGEEDKKSILNSKLAFIDNVLMHYIISGNSNKNFNKYCTDLIDDDKNNGESKSKELNNITLEDLQKGVKNKKNNKLAKLILFFIELHRSSKKGSKSIAEGLKFTDGLELEHILPKKWEEYWDYKKTPYVSDEGKTIPDTKENWINRNEKLYSLGNMTILCSGINKEIINVDFKSKIEGCQLKNRWISGINATIEQEFSITKEYVEKAAENDYVWNEYTIVEREKRLLDEILEIWPLEVTN